MARRSNFDPKNRRRDSSHRFGTGWRQTLARWTERKIRHACKRALNMEDFDSIVRPKLSSDIF